MPDEEVTIRIKADTSGYVEGVSEAKEANKELSAQTKNIRDKMREGWEKVGQKVGLSTKKASENLTGKDAAESVGKAFANPGMVTAFRTALKGVVAGLATVAVVAITEAMGESAGLFDTALVERQANKMNSAFARVKTTVGAIVSPLYTLASEVLTHIANGINTALEGVVQIYGYIMGLIGATDAISRNATEWSENMETATASASAGLAAFDKLNTLDTGALGDEAQAQKIRDLMADASEAGADLRESITETLNPLSSIGNFFTNSGLTRFWEWFTSSALSAWSTISTTAGKAWDTISKAAVQGAEGFKAIVGGAVSTLMSIDLSGAWRTLSQGFVSMWNTTFSTIAQRTDGLINTMVRGLSTVPERMGAVFNGVWNGMAGGIKGVANAIIRTFNAVINAYNNSIGKLRIDNDFLGIHVGFPTMASIPMLASGGIAEPNDPFLAILGDNKKEREFVTPESTMRDVVKSVMEEQGGIHQTIEIPISLDGRIMARATYDYYAREAKRRGAQWL